MTDSLAPDVEVFIDLETGGLRPKDRPWEVALVRRVKGETVQEFVYHLIDFLPGKADPKALEMSGFYQRHPLHLIIDPKDPLRMQLTEEESMLHPSRLLSGPNPDLPPPHHMLGTDLAVARDVERLVRGAVVWACNPAYDVPRLEAMLDRVGLAWAAHYRPMCATTYAAATATALGHDVGPPPYVNKKVGALIGVDRDGFGTAHTGLADCYYAMGLVDRSRALALAARADA